MHPLNPGPTMGPHFQEGCHRPGLTSSGLESETNKSLTGDIARHFLGTERKAQTVATSRIALYDAGPDWTYTLQIPPLRHPHI